MPAGRSPAGVPELVAGRPPSEREATIWTARTGIEILILAILLIWIPVLEYLGYLIGAAGAIQVFRGAHAFGRRYQRAVGFSIAVFAAAAVVAFALDQDFVYAMDVAVYGNPGPTGAGVAVAAYDRLIGGSVVVALMIAVAYVLLAFDLEDGNGRRLLLAGVAVQVAVSIALAVLVLAPFVRQAMPQAFATTPPDAGWLAAAGVEVNGLSPLRLFDAIPAILFAAAYARAFRRIDRGQVPPPVTTPA